MSRIGKKPIIIPGTVKVAQDENILEINGPKGSLSMKIPQGVRVSVGDRNIMVDRISDEKRERSYHGLVRTLIGNMVAGVSAGFEKGLEVSGVGYRAEVGGDTLKMVLGYSNPVEYKIPKGIAVRVDKQVNIVVSGIDKQLVGRVASEIRSLRKPEPYKGKGIKYVGERIRRKVGKSVGA
jgi:large subunit ribosomal protein L6